MNARKNFCLLLTTFHWLKINASSPLVSSILIKTIDLIRFEVSVRLFHWSTPSILPKSSNSPPKNKQFFDKYYFVLLFFNYFELIRNVLQSNNKTCCLKNLRVKFCARFTIGNYLIIE